MFLVSINYFREKERKNRERRERRRGRKRERRSLNSLKIRTRIRRDGAGRRSKRDKRKTKQ